MRSGERAVGLKRILLPRTCASRLVVPVVYSPGTRPNQAEKLLALRNSPPLPIAATIAVAVIGPTPGIAISRAVLCGGRPVMVVPPR